MSDVDWAAEVRRYAVPVLLLALCTAAIFVVRGALQDEASPVARTKVARPAAPRAEVKRAAAKFYVVEYGDTLAEIADRFETSVDRLMELNPGVDARALRVGQRVRVG